MSEAETREMIFRLLNNDEEAHKALGLIQIVLEHMDERIAHLEAVLGERPAQTH